MIGPVPIISGYCIDRHPDHAEFRLTVLGEEYACEVPLEKVPDDCHVGSMVRAVTGDARLTVFAPTWTDYELEQIQESVGELYRLMGAGDD